MSGSEVRARSYGGAVNRQWRIASRDDKARTTYTAGDHWISSFWIVLILLIGVLVGLGTLFNNYGES